MLKTKIIKNSIVLINSDEIVRNDFSHEKEKGMWSAEYIHGERCVHEK